MHEAPRACAPFQRALAILGKRWTGLIVHALLERPCRFVEIALAVQGLSDRMLSERLRELEAEGIVARQVVLGPSARVVYVLTPKGRDLRCVLGEIHRWAERWPAPRGALERVRDERP